MGEEEEGARQQESHVDVSLFETKEARFRGVYKVFASTIFAAICLIWVYRVANIPTVASGRWTWISVMVSELCFGIYWIITQSVRWKIVYQTPFKHRLLQRLVSLHHKPQNKEREPLFYFFYPLHHIYQFLPPTFHISFVELSLASN